MTLETRDSVIYAHADIYVRNQGSTWPTYATVVREIYHQRVPYELRRVTFSEHRDPNTRMRMDAQIIRRDLLGAKYGPPMEIEESMVLALKDLGYFGYDDMLAELNARYGLLAAPIPVPGDIDDESHSLAALLKELGEAVEMVMKVAADNAVNEKDLPHARKTLKEILDAQAQLSSWAKRITDILPESQQPLVVVK